MAEARVGLFFLVEAPGGARAGSGLLFRAGSGLPLCSGSVERIIRVSSFLGGRAWRSGALGEGRGL